MEAACDTGGSGLARVRCIRPHLDAAVYCYRFFFLHCTADDAPPVLLVGTWEYDEHSNIFGLFVRRYGKVVT